MKVTTKFIFLIFHFFCFLGALFIPFTFHILPFQQNISEWFFTDLIILVKDFFPSLTITNPSLSSDSTTLYLLLLLLFVFSLILCVVLPFFKVWKTNQTKIHSFIRVFLTYYLAAILLKYGFDKIFKAQFYLPEPNLLYTPMGYLDKDILYWSTLGLSRSYSIFGGLMEVIPALMLLHRKTRTLALIIIVGVLLHVVSINFSFDISVKLFSVFLLLVATLLLTPNLKNLIRFFVLQQTTSLKQEEEIVTFKKSGVKYTIKLVVITLLMFESLYPYLASGVYNDDNAPRPYLHGAYEVTQITLPDLSVDTPKIKRVFIHRRNYFILQYEDESMEDFQLIIDPLKQEFKLTDYDEKEHILTYTFNTQKNELILYFSPETFGMTVYLKALDWQNLPALQPLFHWTVDEIM
jgi:hypothetical protein